MAKKILQHDVYSGLRHQIISWRRQPDEPLREEQLAREFEVSRTPLREALRKLAEEGLVDYVPHKGARVAQLAPNMIEGVFLIREALEGIAAREAAMRMSGEELSRLRQRFEDLRPNVVRGDFSDVGDDIHERMLVAAANPRLDRAMAGIMGQVQWLQHTTQELPERLLRSFREHESILAALEVRDAEAAESVTRAHIRSTLRDLLAAVNGRRAET